MALLEEQIVAEDGSADFQLVPLWLFKSRISYGNLSFSILNQFASFELHIVNRAKISYGFLNCCCFGVLTFLSRFLTA